MSDVEGNNEENNGDGAGFLEAFEEADRACDEDVRAYYDALTPDVLGEGYFDQRLAHAHKGVNIEQSRTFYTEPHRREISPVELPERHPLRAVAWVLQQAPPRSTVRLYCYVLTCPMAIDLLIHHGADKSVNIIIHPSGQTTMRLEEFFADHGRIARRAFRDRLHVRVADLNIPRRGRYTQMHDKSIITDQFTTFGSYNMTNPGRYQNWESLHVADSEPSHAAHFDALWNSLARRSLQAVYPALAPASPPVKRQRPPGDEGRQGGQTPRWG